MSKPVPYQSGDVRHDIRNTRDGEYLFVPTELMVAALQFILATMARRYNVGIVAYAMMCTHVHILIVDLGDPDEPSDVPEFRRMFRSTFAQFVNAYWGRVGKKVFCPDSVGATIKVVGLESTEEAIAYIENNPMEAGLEKSPERMKGAVSLREWLIEPLKIERPEFFFQKRTWRDVEELRLVVPPEAKMRGHSTESFYRASKSVVVRRTNTIAKTRRRQKQKAKPLHVLRRLRPEDGTGTSTADHSEALLACSDPYRAAIEFALIRTFRHQHALALRALKSGREDVVFPAGTYLAAKRYGVKVRPSASQRWLDLAPG